ncbi:MAG: hypothetical protein QNI96_05185 [Woeseiaceae bacterium]|nr:hypothetical protein [Woeseiaceae bacterium]
MSNEVTPFSENAPVPTNMMGAIAKQAQSGPVTSRHPFLRLLKDGSWVYGPDDTEVQDGSRWMVHPGLLQHGYCCWGDERTPKEGVLCGEIMQPIDRELPAFSTLEVIENASWSEQVSMQLACLNGEDAGTNVMYKVSSVSGRQAYATLCAAIAAQAELDPVNVFPIVELKQDSYKHKRYGKIMTPILEIVGWSDGPGEEGGSTEPEPADEPEAKAEAPKKKRRRRRAAA